MSDTNQIIKAIQFRIDDLEKASSTFVKVNAPTEFLKECDHRIDELKSILEHINKEIIK